MTPDTECSFDKWPLKLIAHKKKQLEYRSNGLYMYKHARECPLER